MSVRKVAVTLEERLLKELDQLVEDRVFPSRSRAIQEALEEKLTRRRRTRLAEQCALLCPEEEQRLADWGLGLEGVEWPEY